MTGCSYKARWNPRSGTARGSHRGKASREPGVSPAVVGAEQQQRGAAPGGCWQGPLNGHSKRWTGSGVHPGNSRRSEGAKAGARLRGAAKGSGQETSPGSAGLGSAQETGTPPPPLRLQGKRRTGSPGAEGGGPRGGRSRPLGPICNACYTSFFIAAFLQEKKTFSPRVIPVSVVSKPFCTRLTVESFIWCYISFIYLENLPKDYVFVQDIFQNWTTFLILPCIKLLLFILYKGFSEALCCGCCTGIK